MYIQQHFLLIGHLFHGICLSLKGLLLCVSICHSAFVTTEGLAYEYHVVLCYFSLTWFHSSYCFVILFYWSPIPCRVLAVACHRERESRFRKLEACTLQVFELCHWRQHSHKVDGCPSPEVFPCQQACSALHRWIQTLCFTDRPFCLGIWEAFGTPPHPHPKKNKKSSLVPHPLCGTGQKTAFSKSSQR